MQPERARGWLNTILPVLREGGPIVSLVLLLIGGLSIWWLLGTYERARIINQQLYERLIVCTKEHMLCEREK